MRGRERERESKKEIIKTDKITNMEKREEEQK